MKRYTLLNFLIPVISSATLLIIIEPSYSQEQAQATGDCPGNPQIGVTTCTEKVTINLRALETFNEERFQKRYEPDPGYKIVGHSVNQIGKTGNSSYPSVNKVQAGNTLATGQQIQTAQKDISETTSKLSGEVKDPSGFAKASAEITNKANSELSQINNFVSAQTTSNHGLDIEAKAAAICNQKNPFKAGSCAIWGPGGSVAAEVVVKLVYVGTPSDIQAVAQKYITELNKAAAEANKVVVNPVSVPPPEQATFGAFYISKDAEQMYWSTNKPTSEAAKEAARKACRSSTKSVCNFLLIFKNSYGAFASSFDNEWGVGFGKTEQQAKDRAEKACTKIAQNKDDCEVILVKQSSASQDEDISIDINQ